MEQQTKPNEVSGACWYLAHVATGREKSIGRNITLRVKQFAADDRVSEVFVPLREESELRDGVKRTIERNVYPGYILVNMVMDDDVWRAVRYTPGVIGFVSSMDEAEGRPTPVPLDVAEVDKIKKLAEQGTAMVHLTYKIGDRIRIKDGPFEDFIGVVDDVNEERSKMRVKVSFLGRETPVELDFLQVQEA